VVPHAERAIAGYYPPTAMDTIPIDECEIWSMSPNGGDLGDVAEWEREHVAPHSNSLPCVIISPGVYHITKPIVFSKANAVVIALGFATFACATTEACVTIAADAVSFAGLILDAAQTDISKPTKPLITIEGARAQLYDVYSRIIAQERNLVRADVMMHVKGQDATLDNTWLWHADHDPWPKPTESYQQSLGLLQGSQPYLAASRPVRDQMVRDLKSRSLSLPYRSDECVSSHALVVDGEGFTVYALLAEHTHSDVVVWNGERGTTYLLQCEVPYYEMGPGTWNASKVAYRVTAGQHEAFALGGYVTNPTWVGAFTSFQQTNMFHFTAQNTLHKVFAWINPPGANAYVSVFNTSEGLTLPLASCESKGGLRLGTACYWQNVLPPAPPLSPGPPPSPPSPPCPPKPPPYPPYPPPPKDTYCYIEDANGGDLGPKEAQTTAPVGSIKSCANFCRNVDSDAFFLMYDVPGYCFCYPARGRAFPGHCFNQPGGVVGTVRADCTPATQKCQPSTENALAALTGAEE